MAEGAAEKPASPDVGLTPQMTASYQTVLDALWTAHELSPFFGTDDRGRQFSDDLRAAYDADSRKRFERVAAAVENRALRTPADIAAAEKLLAETETLFRLFLYWDGQMRIRTQRWLWQRMRAKNADVLGQLPPDPEVEAAEASLKRLIKDEVFNPSAIAPVMQRIVAARTAERIKGTQLIADARAKQPDEAFTFQERWTECAARTSEETTGTRAAKLESAPSAADFYPLSAKRAGIEGAAVLRLHVSATGCVDAAAVLASSGSAALDNAAIELIQEARYIPAGAVGAPVASTVPIRVSFKIEKLQAEAQQPSFWGIEPRPTP